VCVTLFTEIYKYSAEKKLTKVEGTKDKEKGAKKKDEREKIQAENIFSTCKMSA
jgi:hypothetical protein